MTDEAKRILEKFEEYKRNNPPKSRGDIYKDELAEYIISKLQPYNVPYSAIGEMIEYIMLKTNNCLYEEVRDYQRRVEREQYMKIRKMRKESVNND